MVVLSACLRLAPLFVALAATALGPPVAKNPQAVEEVRAGKCSDANAAWWGFDPDDATESLQAAIDSGAKKVVVPNMNQDWVVRPLRLAGNQELVLEEGVVIAAKRGEYRGGGDSVFTAINIDNVTIRGYGATIRMHKEDYIVGLVLKDLGWQRWYGQYPKAEWRMALAIRGCSNVKVLGLTLCDSGGDGIYVDGAGDRICSSNVYVKDVVCDNNYRQGFSVISVDGLTVEDSVFKNTWGTPPSAGVDIEPDAPKQKVKGVVFRNCRFEDNYADGILIFLANQGAGSDDISILFDHCRVSSRRGSGIRVTRIHDDGPRGLIEFRNCVVEHTEAYGLTVQTKAADRARVRFVGCAVRDAARDRNFQGPWAPVWLRPSEPEKVKRFGGIDFVDCVVEDRRARAAVQIQPEPGAVPLSDITGAIRVTGGAKGEWNPGPNAQGVSLKVSAASLQSTAPEARTVEYESPAVGRTLKCRVILPASYESSNKRYPVLYLLHGYSGDYTSWSRHGAERAAAAYDWIVVLPDGGNSWFANWGESEAGQKNDWEDALTKDLIGFIDSHYRTIPARAGRAINGLSMGGFGAVVLGLRNPELFCSIGSQSGALDFARSAANQLRTEPNAKLPARNPSAKINPAIGLDDFDSQEERTPKGRIFTTAEEAEAHDPFALVTRIPAEKLPHLYIDCGTEDPFFKSTQDLIQRLLENRIAVTYAESPGEHNGRYWRREIGMAMAVQYQIIERSLAGRAKDSSASLSSEPSAKRREP
jgi:S-formylglutathione hydrolase FrmB